jgi:hypothetical protein
MEHGFFQPGHTEGSSQQFGPEWIPVKQDGALLNAKRSCHVASCQSQIPPVQLSSYVFSLRLHVERKSRFCLALDEVWRIWVPTGTKAARTTYEDRPVCAMLFRTVPVPVSITAHVIKSSSTIHLSYLIFFRLEGYDPLVVMYASTILVSITT